jgi:lipopolysaccharide biosynthesis glycosyltransferase
MTEGAVLVTLADAQHLAAAQQLFAGAKHTGWSGDFLLLVHDKPRVPAKQLQWFVKRDIGVKRCAPLASTPVGTVHRSPAVLDKFYLFTPFFKRWQNVVFIDVDCILRASVDKIASVKGFAAVPDMPRVHLSSQFTSTDKDSSALLRSSFDLAVPVFNSGVLAFSTDVITPASFRQLRRLHKDFGSLQIKGDQPLLNLFFHKRWQPLPEAFNVQFGPATKLARIKPAKLKGIIIHCSLEPKPWQQEHPLHAEWQRNAALFDASPQPVLWNDASIQRHSAAIRRAFALGAVVNPVDRLLGRIGQLLRR